MSVNLQDVINNVKDYTGNYSTGVNNIDTVIRAINRAIEYLKRKIALPSDEKMQTIWFSADQLYYDLNVDFDESIQLLYHNENLNRAGSDWEYRAYPEILRRRGSSAKREFSYATVNGRQQLVIAGSNQRSGSLLNSMDATTNWTASGDASGLELDEDQIYEGSGSLKFDITASSNSAKLVLSSQTFDMENLMENHGRIKFWNYMTDDNIDDITLYLYTDDSNYYTVVADTTDDGSDFSENEWTKIGFVLDDKLTVGTPDKTDITKIQIEYDLGSGFTSAADFRADYLFSVVPDELDLIYYSRYKGTDITGVTNKVNLGATTDLLAFGNFVEDYMTVVAQKAALILWPQLKGSWEGYNALKADFNENMKTWSRTYPRKRTQIGAMRHRLKR